MKKMLSNFSEFALTRSEMKNLVGGCMPPHWDVIAHYSNGQNKHVLCATSEASAQRQIHYGKKYGNAAAMSWTKNPGTC